MPKLIGSSPTYLFLTFTVITSGEYIINSTYVYNLFIFYVKFFIKVNLWLCILLRWGESMYGYDPGMWVCSANVMLTETFHRNLSQRCIDDCFLQKLQSWTDLVTTFNDFVAHETGLTRTRSRCHIELFPLILISDLCPSFIMVLYNLAYITLDHDNMSCKRTIFILLNYLSFMICFPDLCPTFIFVIYDFNLIKLGIIDH